MENDGFFYLKNLLVSSSAVLHVLVSPKPQDKNGGGGFVPSSPHGRQGRTSAPEPGPLLTSSLAAAVGERRAKPVRCWWRRGLLSPALDEPDGAASCWRRCIWAARISVGPLAMPSDGDDGGTRGLQRWCWVTGDGGGHRAGRRQPDPGFRAPIWAARAARFR